MSATIVLVGTSPATTLSAVLTFTSDHIVLVHGSGRSQVIADEIRDWANACGRPTEFTTIPLPLNEPRGIAEELARYSFPEGADLVYGGGTVPMNTLTYHHWYQTCPNRGQAWYLASNPGRYLPLDAREEVRAAALPTLRDYLSFHKVDLKSAGEVPHFAPTLVDATTEIIGHRSDRPNDFGWPAVTAYLEETSTEPLNRRQVIGAIGRVLEASTSVLFRVLAPRAEILHGAVVRGAQGNASLEMDVIVWNGRLLLCVSCGMGTQLNALRGKAFEAAAWAGELGGSEARSLAVVSPKDLQSRTLNGEYQKMDDARARMRFDIEHPGSRRVIVSARELFGEDAAATFDDPHTELRRRRPDLYRWLGQTLDL